MPSISVTRSDGCIPLRALRLQEDESVCLLPADLLLPVNTALPPSPPDARLDSSCADLPYDDANAKANTPNKVLEFQSPFSSKPTLLNSEGQTPSLFSARSVQTPINNTGVGAPVVAAWKRIFELDEEGVKEDGRPGFARTHALKSPTLMRLQNRRMVSKRMGWKIPS